MALTEKGAGVLVRDDEAVEKLIPCFEELLAEPERIKSLETNILKLARRNSSRDIAQEVIKLARKNG
jgi:UDP-N-acetylglucosamine:LPS N-acetylglucosamine transferase